MNKEKILEHGERILADFREDGIVAASEAAEFLRIYAGEKSSFYKNASGLDASKFYNSTVLDNMKGILGAFVNHVKNDLQQGISLERKVQIDTVSDFLEQAQILLSSSGIHPAAPAMVIGAALEEFLRNWVEEGEIKLLGKAGIENYAIALKEAELIDKQDHKDITSWGGLRNAAAHGKWEEVSNKDRISIMLDGVNLFMRKHVK